MYYQAMKQPVLAVVRRGEGGPPGETVEE